LTILLGDCCESNAMLLPLLLNRQMLLPLLLNRY
jgi:hypothetical protein